MLVEVNAKVIRDDCPDTDIKLPTVEEKRMLDVLLNDPGPDLRIAMKDALIYLPQGSKDLDASALIKRCWLNEPHVLFAVLYRHAFFFSLIPGYLLEPSH